MNLLLHLLIIVDRELNGNELNDGQNEVSIDNQDELNYYQKDFVEQMQSAKYKIFDYTQTQHRGGRIEVSFWYNSVYKGDDPQIVVINQGNLIPIRYKLVFGRSNKVRIYRDSYAITGILKL